MTSTARLHSPVVAKALRDAGLLVIVVVAVARALGWIFPEAADLRAYWLAGTVTPYAISHEGATNAFLYSPAFTQLLEPFRGLPFGLVVGLWTAASLLILRWLAPRAWPLLMLVFVPEIITCNINLFLAALVVASFRHPGVWALAILTKVSPGVGVLWFVVRREWRNLAVALGVTLAIAATSFLLAPGLWNEWLQSLLANAQYPSDVPALIHVSVFVRLPFAVAILVWGARGDRRWTMPLAVVLATPVLWPGVFVILVAVLPLWRWQGGLARLPALLPVPART